MIEESERDNFQEDLAIVGNGAFGTALLQQLGRLVGAKISEIVTPGHDSQNYPSDEAPKNFILAIPSSQKETTLEHIRKYPDSRIILTSKGLASAELYKELSDEEKNRVFILSGPNIAQQIIDGSPTATIIAGKNINISDVYALQQKLNSEHLRFYASVSPEVVQWSGIIKNLLVFELGKVWKKLSSKEKTQILFETLQAGFSVVEKNCPEGENPYEYFGIAGLGDILLCMEFFEKSEGSRNFRGGVMKGIGANDESIEEIEGTVEGLSMSEEFNAEKIPKNLDTAEMRQFREKIQSLSSGDGLIVEEGKEASHLPSKVLFSEVLKVLEAYEELIGSFFGENTKAWVFCRMFLEFIRIFGTEYRDDILQAMLESVLDKDSFSSERVGEYLSTLTDIDESLPLTRFLCQVSDGSVELSSEDIGKHLLNRATVTEGIDKVFPIE
ncbi:hypothetical protein KAI58_03795 [Candidatus Gracilibacteria bacterium]|nr:hypothetical protein [Candidatus Gracilibacteria bacterium]